MSQVFRCRTSNGAVLKIEAESLEQARAIAAERGHGVVSITRTEAGTASDIPLPPQHGTSAEAERDMVLPPTNQGIDAKPERYGNLRTAAGAIITMGAVFKVVGGILAAALICLSFAPNVPDPARVLFFFGGFATGVWFYGLGMLEAAFGEGLHALADIADQTDRIPEPGKAVS